MGQYSNGGVLLYASASLKQIAEAILSRAVPPPPCPPSTTQPPTGLNRGAFSAGLDQRRYTGSSPSRRPIVLRVLNMPSARSSVEGWLRFQSMTTVRRAMRQMPPRFSNRST